MNIPGTTAQGFCDEYLSYDSNGNILTLKRYGKVEDATLTMLTDELKYGYDSGNKLLNLSEEEAYSSGFTDGNIHTQTNLPDFVYDADRNLIRDRSKLNNRPRKRYNFDTLHRKDRKIIV